MINRFLSKIDREGETYFKIKVRPNASKSEVTEEMSDGTWKINVAAVAEKGKANEELIKFLAKELKIRKEDVKIISGAGEHIKLIKIVK